MTSTVKAGALYFAVVFAAGFMLGIVRTLWVEPALGKRVAELAEMPIMLLVIIGAAAWVVRRRKIGAGRIIRLVVGIVGAALVLVAEALLVLSLRGQPISVYIREHDPVTGAVYLLLIGLMAVMPMLMVRRRKA